MSRTAYKRFNVWHEGENFRFYPGDEVPDDVAESVTNQEIFENPEDLREEMEDYFAGAASATAEHRLASRRKGLRPGQVKSGRKAPEEDETKRLTTEDQYQGMSIPALRQEVSRRKLEWSPKDEKDALITKLRDHDASQS